jgi:pyruvyltransferase
MKIIYLKCGKNGKNFGDLITPYIYKKKTGLEYNENNIMLHNDLEIIGSGSIIELITEKSIVWGTGSICKRKFKKPKKVLSVRGPLTRDLFLQQGYECPKIYGDIGLLLPHFYYPNNINKIYTIGIIPHYIHYDECIKLFSNNKDILIINVLDNIEVVINNILQCRHTLSSSLHGIICSHAYSINCAWINFNTNKKLVGGYFKFIDYYSSINFNDIKEPIDINKFIDVDVNKLKNIVILFKNPIFPINTKKILELCPF